MGQVIPWHRILKLSQDLSQMATPGTKSCERWIKTEWLWLQKNAENTATIVWNICHMSRIYTEMLQAEYLQNIWTDLFMSRKLQDKLTPYEADARIGFQLEFQLEFHELPCTFMANEMKLIIPTFVTTRSDIMKKCMRTTTTEVKHIPSVSTFK